MPATDLETLATRPRPTPPGTDPLADDVASAATHLAAAARRRGGLPFPDTAVWIHS